MAHIVLTDEQMKQITGGTPRLEVRDPRNLLIGYLQIPQIPPEEIEEALQALASDQPRYTFAEVMAHLRSLESR